MILSLRLDEQVEKELNALMAQSGKNRSQLVRQALSEFIRRQKKQAWDKEVKKAAASIAAEGLDEDFYNQQKLVMDLWSHGKDEDGEIWWEE